MCYDDYLDLSKSYYEKFSLFLYFLKEHKQAFELISTYFDLDVTSSSALSIDTLVRNLDRIQDSLETVLLKMREIVVEFSTDFCYTVKGEENVEN